MVKLSFSLIFILFVGIALVNNVNGVQSDNGNQLCTDTNFQDVLAKATKLIGRRPTYECARSVFDKICNKCKGNFKCYVSEGKRLAVQIPSCNIKTQYLADTTPKRKDNNVNIAFDISMETVSSKECNDQQFYLRLKKKASSVTGHKLPENCFRNVYKQICGICERDFSCYMLQGRNVAMNMNSCTAPQENLNDEAALFHYLDAIDRHEKRSKLGQLLVMSHEEQFDYHSVAVNDENGFDSKVWIEPTPNQPKGPFFPVSFPDDTNTDLTTLDNIHYAKGIQVYVQGQVMDAKTGKPIENATVEIWQACESGKYDHPEDPNLAPADPYFQYYGKDETTATGKYVFKTIIPGAYPATMDWLRPPHIHYLIKSPQYKELVTQLYFHPKSLLPDEAINYDHIPEELRKGNMEGKPRLPRHGPGFLDVVNNNDRILGALPKTERKRLTVQFKDVKSLLAKVGVLNIYLDPKD
jgi:protocatechuate 3,4-dioxygenase beta subunit